MSARVGFGTSGLGNLYHAVTDAAADVALTEGYDRRIRYFDTSPFYGFGLSELRVGHFLRSVARDSFALSQPAAHWIGSQASACNAAVRLRPNRNAAVA
jgi:D-threo-aldose 1-dehydrogenase